MFNNSCNSLYHTLNQFLKITKKDHSTSVDYEASADCGMKLTSYRVLIWEYFCFKHYSLCWVIVGTIDIEIHVWWMLHHYKRYIRDRTIWIELGKLLLGMVEMAIKSQDYCFLKYFHIHLILCAYEFQDMSQFPDVCFMHFLCLW
jgi:hypothetical protein